MVNQLVFIIAFLCSVSANLLKVCADAKPPRVLIVGGSSGVGKATAAEIVKLGGTAIIVGRSEAKLAAAAAEISPTDDSKVEIIAGDALTVHGIQSIADKVAVGSINHLVVTIGESADCSSILGQDGFNGLKRQFDLKFFAQTGVVSFLADKIADGGSIVLTSGALSRRPGKGNTALAVVNAALEAIVKGLANDLGPRLRVNCVSLGLTNTEAWSSLPDEVRTKMLSGFGSTIPLKRAGESADVGNGIVFLLSNSFVTGVTLDIDGGTVVRP